MEYDKKICPILDVDGVIACGKQFDIDITLPEDNRNVIYGVIRDCYKEPICDAVVKLIEVVCEHGKDIRKPVSHTFTDKEGQFVFGPLCANKMYEIQFWVDRVQHVKVCAKCEHEGSCLKGIDMDKCDCFVKDTNPCKPHHKHEDEHCNDDKCYSKDDEKDKCKDEKDFSKWPCKPR